MYMMNKALKEVDFSLPSLDSEALYFPIIVENGETFEIINSGTAAAPCRLTIIPKNDMMLITIEGLSKEPLTMERIMQNQILVIDGIEKTITIDGTEHFDLFSGWEFPRLKAGTNKIKISKADLMTISIEYQPRYT